MDLPRSQEEEEESPPKSIKGRCTQFPAEREFWSKKILVLKYFGKKLFLIHKNVVKKFWAKKFFGSIKIFESKKIGVKKKLVRNKFF